MKRHHFPKRSDYIQQLEKIGFNYWDLPSGPEQLPYWQEGVTYAFAETQIDRIQEATQCLHDMSLEMVASIVKSGDYPDYFALDDLSKSLIEQSWYRADRSLLGRFDLVYDGHEQIKMLEYNGDTPVSILECSVAQWHYIEQLQSFPEYLQAQLAETEFPDALRIQYNLLDEHLIKYWQQYHKPQSLIHFAASAGFRHEDWGNLIYIMDTASRAGMRVKELHMQDIGWTDTQHFVDVEDYEIRHIFKLYPWEWITKEPFGQHIQQSTTRWMEPAWKMLLSNKAMLVKLWQMFPHHPNLLAAYAESEIDQVPDGTWCKKAIHGREGANIHQVVKRHGQICRDALAQGSHFVPEYVEWGYIYQAWHQLPIHEGYRPVIGSWVIDDQACGMSIREDQNLVTGNDAYFASHFFIPYALEQQYQHLYCD